MLDEDDLAALAHDIEQNGLFQPIVLDREGRILDGRGRLAACERAGSDPVFVTYEGDDPDVYILSVNLRRRSLSKGQAAMITIKARSLQGTEDRSFKAAKLGGISSRQVGRRDWLFWWGQRSLW